MVSPLSSTPIIEQRPLTLPAKMGTGKRQHAMLSLSLEAPTTCCTSRNLRKEWRNPRHYLPSLIVQSLILESHPYWDLSCVPPRCHQASKGGNHLSCCPMALQQGRLTWRHDRALKVLYDFIVSLQPNGRVFCDLKGLSALTTTDQHYSSSYSFNLCTPGHCHNHTRQHYTGRSHYSLAQWGQPRTGQTQKKWKGELPTCIPWPDQP